MMGVTGQNATASAVLHLQTLKTISEILVVVYKLHILDFKFVPFPGVFKFPAISGETIYIYIIILYYYFRYFSENVSTKHFSIDSEFSSGNALSSLTVFSDAQCYAPRKQRSYASP